MIEESLRFFPIGEPQFKVSREVRVLVNRLGYAIKRFAIPYVVSPRRNALPSFIRWDVFTPDGTWIGIEPTPWWAMRLADRHFFGASHD